MKRNLTLTLLMVFVFLGSSVVARPEATSQRVPVVDQNDWATLGGGYGWAEQASGFTAPGRGIHYMCTVDENVVWATAYDGSGAGAAVQEYTKTTDGGKLWTPGKILNAAGLELAMIFALDENKAWAPLYRSGGTNPKGIYHTSDGGANWTRQGDATMYNTEDAFPNVVHFWDENNGFAQGDPIGGYYELYTTTDGGANWTRVPSANIPAPVSGEFGIIGYYDVVGDTIWWGTNKGRVFKSVDRGYNWTVCDKIGNLTFVDIWFKDSMNGILQAKDSSVPSTLGTIYETSDGGETWTLINHTGKVYYSDISYVPGTDNMYVSTGANYEVPGERGASYSLDGGHSWTIYEGTEETQFLATDWASETCGYAGGFNLDQYVGGMYKYTYVPDPGLPPRNLVVDYNEQNISVDLTWKEPYVGELEELVYNTADWASFINDCQPYAVKITNPYDYAVPLISVNFMLYNSNEVITGTADVLVWEDDNGLPGNILYTVEGVDNIPHGYYIDVDVMGSDVVIQPNESIFVGITNFEGGSTQGLLAEDVADQGHSFCYVEGGWRHISEAYQDLTNTSITATILIKDPSASLPGFYNVYRSLKSGDYDYTPIGSTTDTLFTDQTVEAGNTYYYVVTAVYDSLDESVYSNEVSVFVEIATAVEYAYDDGTAEEGYSAGSAGSQLAVRISPDTYPVKLIRIKYYLTEVKQQLIVYAWDDDGPDGEPGTQMIDPVFMVPTPELVANDWNVLTLPEDSQFSIDSGDFYVGWFEPSNSSLIGVDTNGPDYKRSWQYDAGAWYDYNSGTPQNIMMRAVVDTSIIPGVDDDPVSGTTYLRQNYPNPVKGSTTIQYGIKNHHGPVEINVYNILGQKVDSIEGENGVATWNPDNLPSGIYFYKLNTKEFSQTRKMLLIK